MKYISFSLYLTVCQNLWSEWNYIHFNNLLIISFLSRGFCAKLNISFFFATIISSIDENCSHTKSNLISLTNISIVLHNLFIRNLWMSCVTFFIKLFGCSVSFLSKKWKEIPTAHTWLYCKCDDVYSRETFSFYFAKGRMLRPRVFTIKIWSHHLTFAHHLIALFAQICSLFVHICFHLIVL